VAIIMYCNIGTCVGGEGKRITHPLDVCLHWHWHVKMLGLYSNIGSQRERLSNFVCYHNGGNSSGAHNGQPMQQI